MFIKMKSKSVPNTTETLIGKGTLIDGKLVSEASLRIEGKVIGEISCGGDVTIGEHSSVHSDITARSVINAGTIHGSVTASGMLRITSTGKVYGSIQAQTLHIIAGGILHGSSISPDIAKPLDKKREQVKLEKLASGN